MTDHKRGHFATRAFVLVPAVLFVMMTGALLGLRDYLLMWQTAMDVSVADFLLQAAIAAVHGATAIGVIRRKPWARVALVIIALVVSALVIAMFVDGWTSGVMKTPRQMARAVITLLATLTVAGVCVVLSAWRYRHTSD